MTAPFDASAIRLETERLILRPVNPNDLSDIHTIVSDPMVAEPSGGDPSGDLQESAQRMLEYMDDNETLALELKSEGKLVGTVSLQKRNWTIYPIDHSCRGREFGFELNREYWGRELMPEAVEAVCGYCFAVLGYDFLTAGYFLGNEQSARAIVKSGFTDLFTAEHEYPGKWKKMIHTMIKYNPQKEI